MEVNIPGFSNDSKLATSSVLYFMKLVDDMNPHEYSVLTYSAFKQSSYSIKGKIVCGRKFKELEKLAVLRSAYEDTASLILDRIMTSENESVKGSVKRITVPLPACTHSRKRILLLCSHIVGLNQIGAVCANK